MIEKLLRYEGGAGLAERLTKPGGFFDAEFMSVRMFEERPLGSHAEDKLIASMRLHLADLADEIDSARLTQISVQLSSKEACV